MKSTIPNKQRARLGRKAHSASESRILSRFDDVRPGLGDEEYAVRLQEEVAVAIGEVERGDLSTVLHQQADGRKVWLEHSGVHGEAQPLVSAREPRPQPVEAI